MYIHHIAINASTVAEDRSTQLLQIAVQLGLDKYNAV